MQLRTLAASNRFRIAAGGLAGLVVLLLLVLATFPWGVLKSTIERSASARIGQKVTIGSVARVEFFSFTPTLILSDVRVPQPAWVKGEPLARARTVRVTLPVLPLLLGRVRPSGLDVTGLRLALVRDRAGRTNWQAQGARGGGEASPLDDLRLADTIVSYRDLKRDRSFAVRIDSDDSGLRVAGRGTIMGAPVTISAGGPAIAAGQGKPWPFRALIDGPAIRIAATGTMDHPLNARHMTLDVTARADDLRRIDAVIEAGLIGTQPVTLTAHARHDGLDWNITRVAGTVGRSHISGHLSVVKRGGRTRLDGKIVSNAMNFDDLASDTGLAQAAALERAEGLRIVPNTRVNIRNIDNTDGNLTFTIRSMLPGKRPTAFTALSGRITLERQLLTVADLRITLRRGAITGSVRVDQRGDIPVPKVSLDLTLSGATLSALGGGDDLRGRAEGRVRLTGIGSTIREAVGNSDGMIALVGRDGSLPEPVAAMLGFDVGGALLASRDDRAALRCLILRLDMRRGVGTLSPLVVDTGISQSRGTGTIRFPGERLAITLTGAPKGDALIRLPTSATIGGMLRTPSIAVAPGGRAFGNILKGLGRAITGNQGAKATDADCDALAAQAMR